LFPPFRTLCRICGVEVETTLYRTHIESLHPEYVEWSRRWEKWPKFIVGSLAAFVILDLLYLRSLWHNFGDIAVACTFAIFFLWIGQYARKMQAFRDAWRKDHPVPDREP